MPKIYFYKTIRASIPKKVINDIVKMFFKVLRVPKSKEVSIVIISDQKMRKMNKMYRGEDCITDVLSFSEGDASVRVPGNSNFLGEIFISYPQVRRQAKENKNSIIEEISILLIHGLAHLMGFEHNTPQKKKQMIRIEQKVLRKLELRSPAPE